MRVHRIIGLLMMLAANLTCSLGVQAAGLLAPIDRTLPPLRITNHAVNVDINDQIALTTINQTFRNDTRQRLEATYVFPLPENAELTNFQMSFNGKMVQGEVLPAEKAKHVYESIVRQMKDPGLIEFIGTRLLQMRVFPIEPESDVQIQVKYQQICRPISGMSGYHYPLRTSKTAGQAYGTVRLDVRLRAKGEIKTIWSPTHTVEIVRDGEHSAKIAYEASNRGLEDDFLLLFDTADGDLGLSVVAHKPDENASGHFVLTLTPRHLWPQQEYQPQDVVFVMDTSGSMSGEKIEQARAALKFCIDKLDERDRFSIVRFSTGFDVFGDALGDAGAERKAAARGWVDKFTAAGGTNINDALRAALDLRPLEQREPHILDPEKPESQQSKLENDWSRPFVVVFITDGQGNQPAEDTLKMVANHPRSAGARIFSFGVGHDVNTVFLDQLGLKHNGKPTYVQPGENLELVLGDFFSVISQPVLTNLRIALPDIGASERFPATLGDLYHGQQIIIAGRFDKPLVGEVKLTAMRGGSPIEFVWPNVNFTHTAEATYVPTIWAGRKIAYLLDQIRATGPSSEMIEEVVALGMRYGIQTPYTSWLVNPEQIQVGGGGGGGFRPHNMPLPAVRAVAPDVQRRAFDGAGLETGHAPAPSGTSGGGGRGGVNIDLTITADDVGKVSGEGATTLARRNAEMRESRARDKSRVDENVLVYRRIGDRGYNRVGRYWVDERINDTTRITVVKFGTDAWFTLVERLPDLRPALAADRNIAVMVRDGYAIIVSETEGVEQFDEVSLKSAGIAGS